MAYINSYKPPAPPKPTLQDDLYDINFALPLPATLETPLVKLIPFIPSQHAQRFFDGTKGHDLFRYMPWLLTNLEDFLSVVEWIRVDPTNVLLLIIDKTKVDPNNHDLGGGTIAGIIGLLHTSQQHLVAEIGPVVILPPVQRTHVSANAIGLMMRFCFDLPSAGGLGLRRLQWTANPVNKASIKVAEKMGFVYEGTMRWTLVLQEGKEGKGSREGDPVGGPGRDSVLLAICWDDWEGEVRERVVKLMEKV
jgi:RimJ/RimL family protein N-acetyltransferase